MIQKHSNSVIYEKGKNCRIMMEQHNLINAAQNSGTVYLSGLNCLLGIS